MAQGSELYYLEGKKYFDLMEFDLALSSFERALELLESANNPDEMRRAELYNRIALCHYYRFDATRAYDYMQRSLEIKERLLDPQSETLKIAQENLVEIKREMHKGQKYPPHSSGFFWNFWS